VLNGVLQPGSLNCIGCVMDKVTAKRRKHVKFDSSSNTVAHIGADFTFTLLITYPFLKIFL